MKITKLRFGIVTAADRVDLSIKTSGKLEVGGGCLLGIGVRGCPNDGIRRGMGVCGPETLESFNSCGLGVQNSQKLKRKNF